MIEKLKYWFFIFFGLLSVLCFFVEAFQIINGVDFHWSDHLHNLIDHIAYIIINMIGFNMFNQKKELYHLTCKQRVVHEKCAEMKYFCPRCVRYLQDRDVTSVKEM